MSLFLLTFLLVYGSLHAYALLRAKAALGFGWGAVLLLLPLLAALLCAPIIAYHLGHRGYENSARGVAFAGYLWMGFLFLFACMHLAADIASLFLRLPGRTVFLCIAGMTAALTGYSIFEASSIEVVRVRIPTDKLPPSVPRLRIAQISDLHLGLIHRSAKAREVARIVSRERPDLFISTGDLVDGQLDHIDGLADIFREIPAPLGKFAVTGNHEYYAGLDRSIAFTARAGFEVLRDRALDVGGIVRIAGVDDPAQDRFGHRARPSEKDVVGSVPGAPFTVLLKHRPAIDPESAGTFDLQLSGHTHHGQIFPFRLLTWLVYPLLGGDHPVPGGGTLHVSRGTGTWGPPMRLLAPPEITIIDLEGRP